MSGTQTRKAPNHFWDYALKGATGNGLRHQSVTPQNKRVFVVYSTRNPSHFTWHTNPDRAKQAYIERGYPIRQSKKLVLITDKEAYENTTRWVFKKIAKQFGVTL